MILFVWVPLFCLSIFLVATQVFDLPRRNWAIVSVGLCALSYWMFFRALRLAERKARTADRRATPPAPGEPRPFADRFPILGRILRSPTGLLGIATGCTMLLVGADQRTALIFIGVAIVLIVLKQFEPTSFAARPPILGRILRSPTGLLGIATGSTMLLVGADQRTALILLGVGTLLIALRQIER